MASRRRRPKKLAPVRVNAGLEARYRTELDAYIGAMNRDVLAVIRAEYPDVIAQDASPIENVQAAIEGLRMRWGRNFGSLSTDLARYFAQAATDRTDTQLRAILRKAGWTVDFTITPAIRDLMQASIAENVALIKSIPDQYFTQIEGHVMRAAQVGGDMGPLAQVLEHQYGVTRRRAAFIARDQTRKAMAVVERARQEELGITHAYWKHSAGGKHPRPTHVKASRDGVIYDINEGWLDPALGKRIWPGTEPNCRCFCRAVLPALADFKLAA